MGEFAVSYEDVVLAGMLGDEWNVLVARTAEGVARETSHDDPAGARRVAESFRRAHHLESGQDLRSWLAERELDLAGFESHARRESLLELGAAAARPSLLPDGFDEALRVDSFCSGYWRDGARRVVQWMAAPGLLGHGRGVAIDVALLAQSAAEDPAAGLGVLGSAWCEERLATLAAWGEALDLLTADLATDAAVRSLVDRHWEDWTRLELDACVFPSEPAAREAMLCATEDGDTPDEIARRAGNDVQQLSVTSGDLGPELGPVVLCAAVDAATGPVRLREEWAVLWVRDRSPADPADPEVRAMAADVLVEEAVAGATRGELRWHGLT
jgi:hypothetical protein